MFTIHPQFVESADAELADAELANAELANTAAGLCVVNEVEFGICRQPWNQCPAAIGGQM